MKKKKLLEDDPTWDIFTRSRWHGLRTASTESHFISFPLDQYLLWLLQSAAHITLLSGLQEWEVILQNYHGLTLSLPTFLYYVVFGFLTSHTIPHANCKTKVNFKETGFKTTVIVYLETWTSQVEPVTFKLGHDEIYVGLLRLCHCANWRFAFW